MEYENNPKSIKYHVKKYLINNIDYYKGKEVLDFPAGNGITSRILKEIGANPIPMDLFPEYFEIKGITCQRVNIKDGLPLNDKSVDAIICQEGIEHFSDQYEALKEFNRVLKDNGILLITTPNYSNLRAKLSYLLSESERFNTKMPPNELDSIWMLNTDISDEIYFGHIFLIGIQKLRTLAKLSGFRINKYIFTRVKFTLLLFFLIFYPFIFISNSLIYLKNIKKNSVYNFETRKQVYSEIFRLSINPKILISSSIMIEFIKEQDYNLVAKKLKSKHKNFGIT